MPSSPKMSSKAMTQTVTLMVDANTVEIEEARADRRGSSTLATETFTPTVFKAFAASRSASMNL